MLSELYDYTFREKFSVRPGFKEKNVKFYISFGADESFLGFEPIEKGNKILCPDIGSLANGTTKSNVLAEKIYIILNIEDKNGKTAPKKSEFYIDCMKQASESDELFAKSVFALEKNHDKIIFELENNKNVKSEDVASIKFDGRPLEESDGYIQWWNKFRKELDQNDKTKLRIDFITGELCEPKQTVEKISGLISVGGHQSGDSLICFDKGSFKSYNLEQAANATVGENSVAAVNFALERLLKDAKPFAGAKNIHWYKENTENDCIDLLDNGNLSLDINMNFQMEESQEDDEQKIADNQRIGKLFESVFKNNLPPNEVKNRYYMMSLSGVGGRIMVRSYDEGSYKELFNSISAWYKDLKIFSPGYGCKFPKLWGIYGRMLKYSDENKRPQKMSENISKELSGISNQIIYAILHNTQFPDTAAAKVLQYIRSDIYSSANEDTKKSANIDIIACQFLKAWLNRKYRSENKEEFIIMETLNKESPSKAYHVGRLMAVYAQIQRSALGNNIGAGVIEKYYTSCCTAPALVIGKLATLSQYHLSKIENGQKVWYSKMLQEICNKIGYEIPSTFSLEQQSQFALGFYFQNSEMYKKSDSNENTETEE